MKNLESGEIKRVGNKASLNRGWGYCRKAEHRALSSETLNFDAIRLQIIEDAYPWGQIKARIDKSTIVITYKNDKDKKECSNHEPKPS